MTTTIDGAQTPVRAADLATFAEARELVLSSAALGWRGVQAQVFRMHNRGRMRLTMPAVIEQVITIQTGGVTTLQGRNGRAFPSYSAGPGDTLTLPMGEQTTWEWTTACEITCLFFDPATLAEHYQALTARSYERVGLAPRTNHHDPLIHQLGAALRQELAAPGPLGRLYCEALLQTIALRLLRTSATPPLEPQELRGGLGPQVLGRVLEYIEASLGGELSHAEIAGVAGISQYHFARLFRASVGEPPHRYVLRRRLERARGLLLEGQDITTAAALTGFADQSHLHRLFKRHYGITPGALVRQRGR